MPTTYEPIATSTLGSAANSITFSSISSIYTDLRLVLNGISGNSPSLRFNGVSSGTYSMTTLYGTGSSLGSYNLNSSTEIPMANGVGPNTTTPYLATADIFSYTASVNKTVLITLSNDQNGSGSTERTVGLWSSTSAITSVTVFGTGSNFAAGTTATLYGIKAA